MQDTSENAKKESAVLFASHNKTSNETQARRVISDCGTTLEAVDRPH